MDTWHKTTQLGSDSYSNAKSGVLPGFVNKVLLQHRNSSLPYYLWLLHITIAELSSVTETTQATESKIVTTLTFTEKVASVLESN